MSEFWVLGIEIGGTKLQLGIGQGQGSLLALDRLRVDPSRGAAGILDQINGRRSQVARKGETRQAANPGGRHRFRRTGRRPKWTHPKVLPDHWLGRFPTRRLDRRASGDSAGRPGKRRGHSRVGGSPLWRGRGSFAALVHDGWQRNRRRAHRRPANLSRLGPRRRPRLVISWYRKPRPPGFACASSNKWPPAGPSPRPLVSSLDGNCTTDGATGPSSPRPRASRPNHGGHLVARRALARAIPTALGDSRPRPTAVAFALTQAIALLAPRRIVIGGGVSLVGDELWFDPIRRLIDRDVFGPFRGRFDIVPAALGEEVVVHGALALARDSIASTS